MASGLSQKDPARAEMGAGGAAGAAGAGDVSARVVEATGLWKSHAGRPVLRDVDFTADAHQTIALVGPSGAGKSTLLRALAGLEAVDSGQVRLCGEVVRRAPGPVRRIGFLFQNYALFPHLSVRDNLAYPLRRAGVARAEIAVRVAEALQAIGLTRMARRRPGSLSGGEQQRVALMRAIIHRPEVVFLDEPFSALDVGLALDLEDQLFRISRDGSHATVLVTHDPSFALSVADTVYVLRDGQVEQRGTPTEVWSSPASAFVARFFGPVNELAGEVDAPLSAGAEHEVRLAIGRAVRAYAVTAVPAGPVTVIVRPSALSLEADPVAPDAADMVTGRVQAVRFRGPECWVDLALAAGTSLTAQVPGARSADFEVGAALAVRWRPRDAVVFADRASDDA